MLGLIFDVSDYELNNFWGIESYRELPLLDKNIGQHLFNELTLAGADNIRVISFDEVNMFCSDGLDDDFYLCVFSDSFLEFNTDELKKAIMYLSDFYIKDSNGNISGIYCRKKTLSSIIIDCISFSDLYSKIAGAIFGFPEINCIVEYHKLNSCSEYLRYMNELLKHGNAKTLPEVAQGIFTPYKIPYGDYIIIPPVYFGENVQIEKGCVIGPGTVIYNNVLIANGTTVRESVIFDNTYISNNCFVDGALCCNNTSLRRNSAVFKGSVIGKNSIIGEGVALENNSLITVSSRVESLDFTGLQCNAGQSENYTQFYGYTPQKAALLGSCLGNVLNMPSVAVIGDGELNSVSIKLSLLGGLVSTGSRCFDFGSSFMSSLYYFVDFCELDYGIFVSGNDSGTVITITDKCANSLTSLQMGELSNLLSKGRPKYCTKNECKKIRVITSLGRMYIQNLIKNLNGSLNLRPIIECENKCIRGIIKSALSKLRFDDGGEIITFKINEQGTKITAEYKEKFYNENTIERIVSYFTYLDCSSNNFGFVRNNDAVQLCFKLLEALNKNNIGIDEAEKQLPQVYVAENEVEHSRELSSIASHICEYTDLVYSNGCLKADDNDAEIKIFETGDKKRYKISVKSSSFEFANELAGELAEMINRDISN